MTAGKRSDSDRILDMWSALGLGEVSDELYMVTIPGAPWSKSRPRFSRNGTYRPKDDMDAEKRTALYLGNAVKTPYTGNVGIVCLFFRPNFQRIDTDNLIKHVCDAANGVLWKDDSQCTGVMGIIELDADNPRTVVGIGRHVTTLKRGTDDSTPCQACGKAIPLARGRRGNQPKTCSRECSSVSKGHIALDKQVSCTHCGISFKRKTLAQKICTEDCRKEFMRGRPQRNGRPRSRCIECDKKLDHYRGGRCRDCWRVHTAKRHTTTDLSSPTNHDQKMPQRGREAAITATVEVEQP